MSAGAPWSVKGIDPKARKVAKELARRSGVTLGEWLNRVILEDDVPDEVTAEEQFAGRPRRMSNHDALDSSRIAGGALPRTEDDRIALVLERLTDHIASTDTRTGLAISGVEHSIRLASARIDTAEREQAQLANHFKRFQAEPAGPRSTEAMRVLEARVAEVGPERLVDLVVQRLDARLEAATDRTAETLDSLKSAVVALDGRLTSVEAGATAGVEPRLASLDARLQVAERRSTQAVEQIGHQVLSMAEAVSRKLSEVDERSAEAIDQVGTEVARIASAVELRLARAEHAQSEAFERLGQELGRVRESLDLASPAAPELETPQPLSVESPVAEIAPEGAYFTMLAPQPELIAEAAEASMPPPPEPEPEEGYEFQVAAVAAEASEPDASEPEAADVLLVPELLARAEEDSTETWGTASPAPEWSEPKPQAFTPLPDAEEDIFEVESRVLPDGAPPPLSTREVIEQARAAARAAKGKGQPFRTRADRNAATGRFFRGFGSRKAKVNSTLQTALMVAGGAAFLSVGAAGLTLMEDSKAPVEQVAEAPAPETPRAGIALGPTGFAPAGPAAVAPTDSVAEFPLVQAEIEAGRVAAVDRLKVLAAAAYPPAQLYLAQILESGAHGQAQNLVEARRLTALAAEAGEPKAMHNLAVYYFRGDGGAQDLASAAQWFRKAAAAGVVESQFNLGLLYQSGSGVTKDLAQARQWFERAAASGDAEAREAALALNPKNATAAAPLEIRDAQRILARLGYYKGAADGRATPAYRTALAGYQRQHGRQPTGALDPATVSALSVYRR